MVKAIIVLRLSACYVRSRKLPPLFFIYYSIRHRVNPLMQPALRPRNISSAEMSLVPPSNHPHPQVITSLTSNRWVSCA